MTGPRAWTLLALLCAFTVSAIQDQYTKEFRNCSSCKSLSNCFSLSESLQSGDKNEVARTIEKNLCRINLKAPFGKKLSVCCDKTKDFCWLARLVYTDIDGEKEEIIGCGGSLISQTMILTAGHCLKENYKKGWEMTHVRLGKLRNGACLKYECQFTVKETIVHDKYDIGLIKLNKNVMAHFVPVSLGISKATYNNRTNLIYVPVANMSDNWSVIKNWISGFCIDTSDKYCMLPNVTGSSSWPVKGDSGTPLMIRDKYNANAYYQVGVLSGVNYNKKYFIFVKLQPLLEWIHHNLVN